MLVVDGAVEQQEMVVKLSGHIHHPGEFLWREGMRVSDLIKSVKSLKSNTDLDFALLRRELPPVGRIEPIFIDLRAVLSDPNSRANINFHPNDELIVFSNEANRAAGIAGCAIPPAAVQVGRNGTNSHHQRHSPLTR